MKNLKRKNLVLALLVLFALAVTGTSYAYWASSVTGNNASTTGKVTVGAGETATTTVTVGAQTSAGPLVPFSRAEDTSATDVEYVVLTFAVTWAEATDLLGVGQATSTLSAVISNKAINASTTYAGLVITNIIVGGSAPTVTAGESSYTFANADATPSITLDGTVNVYVLVQLGEPADQTAYTAVANKDITFDIAFTVANI